MLNILSAMHDRTFSGKEILDWAKYQVENKTSKEKFGKQLLFYYEGKIKADRQYILYNYGWCNWRHWATKNIRLYRVRT